MCDNTVHFVQMESQRNYRRLANLYAFLIKIFVINSEMAEALNLCVNLYFSFCRHFEKWKRLKCICMK